MTDNQICRIKEHFQVVMRFYADLEKAQKQDPKKNKASDIQCQMFNNLLLVTSQLLECSIADKTDSKLIGDSLLLSSLFIEHLDKEDINDSMHVNPFYSMERQAEENEKTNLCMRKSFVNTNANS